MFFRGFDFPGPTTSAALDRYAALVMETLRKQGLDARVEEKRLGMSPIASGPYGKLVVRRSAPGDRRLELHYLLRDRADRLWELTYLIRSDGLDRWRPLLAEIEGVRRA
jgi:hypothetical protein